MLQSTALDILKSGRSVFLTGAPGAGKTYVLNQFVEWARTNRKHVSITASTGIASTHIDGQTIHAWNGLGINDALTNSLYQRIRKYRAFLVSDDAVRLDGMLREASEQAERDADS